MLTNRCICCNNVLTEAEGAFDSIINDYNDMCNYCLRTARDFRYQNDEDVLIMTDVDDEEGDVIDEPEL